MRETVEVGKETKFKILLIDPEEHKIALGLCDEPTE